MKKLNDDWLTAGTLDFEYKKYLLLAYLQHVEKSFEAGKLYPAFADLIVHYRNASALKENKSKLLSSFPKKLKSIDLAKFKLFFEAVVEDDSASEELQKILDFSLNQMKDSLTVGKALFDEIEEQLEFELVGLSALNHDEGLLVLNSDYDPFLHVFKYKLSFFETAHERVKALRTQFIEKVQKGVNNTVDRIKMRWIKALNLEENFTTYQVNSWNAVPLEETLIPVVKRTFSQMLEDRGRK